MELARDNVLVTAISPGLMRTGSPVQATFAGNTELAYALFAPIDSMPAFAISARRAAERILDAAERGEAHVILSLQANLLGRLYALAPRTTIGLLTLVDRLLPRGDGSRTHRFGHESTGLVDRAGIGRLGAGERDRMHELLDTPSSG